MRILFLHQNFPGQFLHVASALRRQSGHQMIAIVPDSNDRPPLIPTRVYHFDPGFVRTSVQLADHLTQRIARGEAVASAMLALRHEGFTPDIVLGHGGWGETLFVRDVWPDCRIVLHAEFFYSVQGVDAGFDPEFSGVATARSPMDVRTRNAAMTLALLDADRGIAPTEWQASRFPEPLRSRISVLHEGIDTNLVRPSANAEVRSRRSGQPLRAGDEVVTFVNRNLEPHRGYHIFMRALPAILERRPNARAVIVGGDEASYGPPPASGKSWKQVFLDEVRDRLDLDRVHFLGRIPYQGLIRLLQVSAAHVYLTYPFVLSWSVLDAMSAGTLVIGSRTPPVEEVIEHGKNGILCDFFDTAGLADAVVNALANPGRYHALRRAGRETIERRFDLRRICLPHWFNMLNELCPNR
jgi:glycosyltransferase involved in cell wall biosynthesis